MKQIFKTGIACLAVAATLAGTASVQAGDWRDGGYGRHHHYKQYRSYRPQRVYIRERRDNDDAIIAGVAGLAAGAVIGSLVSQPRTVYRQPTYVAPARPAPVYSGYYSAEPWSPEWYRACSARYRSFDPGSGTYMGYDGQRHFCEPR